MDVSELSSHKDITFYPNKKDITKTKSKKNNISKFYN